MRTAKTLIRLGGCKMFLYLTKELFISSIIQSAHRTYKRVFEDADVGILWSNVVEETRVPGENHRPSKGDHYPAKCRHLEANAAVTSEGFIPALSRHYNTRMLCKAF